MPMALPSIGKEFDLGPTLMGAVISSFFAGYGLMQIPGGLIADRIGARRSVVLGVASWSIFSFLTGTVANLRSLIGVRICFGLGEGIHPPATFKMLAGWFNSGERSRANGIMMSSNTIGPMVTPILFAAIIKAFGWRQAFYVVSIPGLLIAAAAYYFLRDNPVEHPRMTTEELTKIGSGNEPRTNISFAELLKYKTLWQLFFIYMTWDVTWWGFQAWLPSYLLNARGFSMLRTGALATLPFAGGFVGLMLAAYLSDWSGRRKFVLLVALSGNALFMVLTATASTTTRAVIFLTITGFFLPAIQGPFWSLPMDLLPAKVMGYSTGFINTGGQIAGVIAPIIMGLLIQVTKHYEAGFVFMAISASVSAVLVAMLKDQGRGTMPSGLWHKERSI
jgi:sugar phosphate permease